MQSGLAASFLTPSKEKKMERATNLLMTNLLLTKGSHQAQQLQKVF
jgi:hypothetical protein